MYTVKKTLTISAAHLLVGYPGKCRELHGHNWKITVTCKSRVLHDHGMVVDFSRIKDICMRYDHVNINNVLKEKGHTFPTTAENIARILCEEIPRCVKVEVEETEGSIAIYEKEPDE